MDLIINKFLDPRTWVNATIGSAAIESVFRLAPKLKLTRLDFPLMNGTLIFPPGPKAKVAGGCMYFFGAVSLAAVFGQFTKGHRFPVCKGFLLGTRCFCFSH